VRGRRLHCFHTGSARWRSSCRGASSTWSFQAAPTSTTRSFRSCSFPISRRSRELFTSPPGGRSARRAGWGRPNRPFTSPPGGRSARRAGWGRPNRPGRLRSTWTRGEGDRGPQRLDVDIHGLSAYLHLHPDRIVTELSAKLRELRPRYDRLV